MTFTEEQTMLKDAARVWVAQRAPVSALRAVRTVHEAEGFDPSLYREMVEMGWAGVVVPEAYGGYSFGYTSIGLVAEELGRTLTASPLLSSAVAAATALALCGSESQKSEWLPRIVAGEIIATLAIDEGLHHDPASTALVATASGQGWRLTGTKRPVPEAMAANLFIVVARTGQPGEEDGISLFLCPSEAPGLHRTPLRQVDSRGAAIVTFDDVELGPDAPLGPLGGGSPLLDQVLDRSRAVLAAEMLGSTLQAFDTTIDYLKTRVQFGKLIGSFQALQHRSTDMLAEIELTRSAVLAALRSIDSGSEDLPVLASLAKALAGDTFRHVAREMVQIHGGIGMTDEHDAGLYLKRAHAADMTWGNSAFHRQRYGLLAGI